MDFRKYIEADYYNKNNEDFWGNVGAGILPIANDTKKLLIAYRSAHVNEPHTWGTWGGKIDDEEKMNIQEEAKREFKEESGYNGPIKLIPAYIFKSPNGGFEYHNFIGLIPNEFKPTYSWENEDHKWLTMEELLELKPKHFGLEMLLKNSYNIIDKLIT